MPLTRRWAAIHAVTDIYMLPLVEHESANHCSYFSLLSVLLDDFPVMIMSKQMSKQFIDICKHKSFPVSVESIIEVNFILKHSKLSFGLLTSVFFPKHRYHSTLLPQG